MKKLTFLFGLLFCWMQIFAQHQPDGFICIPDLSFPEALFR
jgi:hypothetical protein